MSSRFYRFLAAILLVFLIASGCNAELEEEVKTEVDAAVEADCNADEGECANPEAHLEVDVPDLPPEDPNCPSREYVIRCSSIHLDSNKNGKLERAELQSAIDSLPWFKRGIINILGSVDKMMKKCDMDGDDAISMDYDMANNGHQCLASCFKRRAFKGAFFPDCA